MRLNILSRRAFQTRSFYSVVAGSLIILGGCSDSPTSPSAPSSGEPGASAPSGSGASSEVLRSFSLYVDPSSAAQKQVNAWRSARPGDAAEIRKIAEQPQATWFGDWNSDVYQAVRNRVSQAASAGDAPVLVAYNIPMRDCGSYSGGGARSADAYRQWIRNFARGLGGSKAVVILEPDALAGSSCLSSGDRAAREALLLDAVKVLKSAAGARVYIDAGNPRWINVSDMSSRLKKAGISQADGFSLNVSNFVSTEENISYGNQLSKVVGGKHFVIDTSRNGRGPASGSEWCNPAGRGLGKEPTTRTGHSLVDAFLWVKVPGESDGTCNGGPSAGTWWADYALGLAKRAAS